MTTVNSGNDEFDFRLIFGEDSPQPGLGPAGLYPSGGASRLMGLTRYDN